ncbi:MAG: exodeoxyribonuclease VII large subunit [Candidatus Latescibacteria bacterium]|nr:exodeoxyribonuclease VII large subunit [Candidatus Latescibacterota bacterium]
MSILHFALPLHLLLSTIHMITLYTVSQVTKEIRTILEVAMPGPIGVEGEIVDFTHHSSGHRYFTLKDEKSQLRCVMWRQYGTGLFFTPQPGMKVITVGMLTVYERGGQYQLVAQRIQPAGAGELRLALEQLKQRLEREGVFDPARKRSLPEFPRTVGVVTSPTGAAVQDIIEVIRRRFPCVRVLLRPTQVQGEGAADDIALAIKEMNEYGKVDVLIVGRGGGAAEDLWAFNEEVVVRAIIASKVPVISAVGHETDVTIADFVADCRAPTPSAAAELVVKDRDAVVRHIDHLTQRAIEAMRGRLKRATDAVEVLKNRYGLKRFADSLSRYNQWIDDAEESLCRATEKRLEHQRNRMMNVSIRLRGLDPRAALRRGFSLCYRLPDGSLVRESTMLHPGGKVAVQFATGRALCRVEELYVGE